MARSKTAKTTANKVARPARAKDAAVGGLDAVARALTAGDAAAALLAALEAWRAAPSPALADLIDVLSSRIACPPIADDLAWSKAAASKDPLALGGLLAAISELPASFLPNAAPKLAAFADDPRIARAAMGWIVDPPTQSSSTYPFWTALYKLLERIADTRVIAAIDQRLKLPMEASKQFPKAKNQKPSQFWGKYYAALEKLKRTLSEHSPAPIDKAAIAKLSKQAGKLAIAAPEVTSSTSTSPKGAPLSRALAHATEGKVPETIAALLDAWRDKRAPELADLIDQATRLLPSYRETLPVDGKAAHAAWQAACDRLRADDPTGELPRLLRHVHVGGAAAATEHVISLAALPDDPRIASRLAELASTANISPERGQYWKSTWELIARTGDTRVIAPLRRDFDDFTGTYYDHHRSGKRLLGPFLFAEHAPSLDAADHKAILQLTNALARIVPDHVAQERALIADIVANWSDEAPRLVYADWLLQRENLRGDFLVLDCKQARGETLTKAESHRRNILRGGFRAPSYLFGPVSDFHHVIDRGLPSQITVNWYSSEITFRHLAGDLLLPCVEAIEFDTHGGRGRPAPELLAAVMLDPTATRLSRVDKVPNDVAVTRVDPRFEPRGAGDRLADALEPLVNAQWKRDDRNFLRK